MEIVTTEIKRALVRLNIAPESFTLMSEDVGAGIYNELLSTFVEGEDRRWWWESFSQTSFSVEFPDSMGFKRICSLVPNSREIVWFMVEENQLPFFPIYEACPEDIQNVIGECYGFEYYIIPKFKNWLLCENHHNRMIGIGEKVVKRLKSYSA